MMQSYGLASKYSATNVGIQFWISVTVIIYVCSMRYIDKYFVYQGHRPTFGGASAQVIQRLYLSMQSTLAWQACQSRECSHRNIKHFRPSKFK